MFLAPGYPPRVYQERRSKKMSSLTEFDIIQSFFLIFLLRQ